MFTNNSFNEVPENVHSKVLQSLDSLEKTRIKTYRRFFKVAALCLLIACVSGITVYAAEAVQSYKQRMLELSKQQLQEYYNVTLPSEAIRFSRPLTDTEKNRYDILENEYLSEGRFPIEKVQYIDDASDYQGKGVSLEISTGILHLPDIELTDEELLQIIDFFKKTSFSVYALNQEWLYADHPWHKRMEAMSDEEIDKAYITLFSGEVHVSGSRSRKLSEEEQTKYEELNYLYENKNRIPFHEIMIIETPEEYTGESVAICVQNSTYYLPDRILTDEECLQIIDMNHKANYSIDKIAYEVIMGLRTHYPGYENE
jgi:hypothetical protein